MNRFVRSLLVPAVLVLWGGPAGAAEPAASPPAEMALVKGGAYLPLYGDAAAPVRVDAFYLDIYPVTNAEFLGFARAHEKWRKAQVSALFAEAEYLAHWAGELELGERAPPRAPVTNVSWFAAKAYCAAQGKRLPTMDEWEYAARAGQDRPDAAGTESFDRLILDWYGKPTRVPLPDVGATFRNYWGVWDMHGLVWEWVLDFNSVMITGASRKDTGLDRRLFCAAGSVGSVDPSDYAAFLRYGMRGSLKANYTTRNLGFRCAKGVSP